MWGDGVSFVLNPCPRGKNRPGDGHGSRSPPHPPYLSSRRSLEASCSEGLIIVYSNIGLCPVRAPFLLYPGLLSLLQIPLFYLVSSPSTPAPTRVSQLPLSRQEGISARFPVYPRRVPGIPSTQQFPSFPGVRNQGWSLTCVL